MPAVLLPLLFRGLAVVRVWLICSVRCCLGSVPGVSSGLECTRTAVGAGRELRCRRQLDTLGCFRVATPRGLGFSSMALSSESVFQADKLQCACLSCIVPVIAPVAKTSLVVKTSVRAEGDPTQARVL